MTAQIFDTTSPANLDKYWHKPYIARNHRHLHQWLHLCRWHAEIPEYSRDVVETQLHETETEIETETKNLFTQNMPLPVVSKWAIYKLCLNTVTE